MNESPKVSLIVPAHNEEENLNILVKSLTKGLSNARFSYEIVLVNDNSTDGTGPMAEKLSSVFQNLRVIHRNPPNGIGLALKDGFRHAKGEILIPVMADLSDEPRDIITLVENIGDYDVVYGSRFVNGGEAENYPFFKMLINRGFNSLIRTLFRIKERDITNAFKAYRKSVIEKIGVENLESDHFDILIELPLKALMLGFRSIEVPVSWHGRKKGTSKLNLAKMGPFYLKRLLRLWLA